MKKTEEQVVKNIIKIRESNGFSKRKIAMELGINEASYGRIESGEIALSYDHLAKIANFYQMSVIDVITYPDVYVKKEESLSEPVEAILQIKLQRDKKDQVLKLIFGDNDIEILNKYEIDVVTHIMVGLPNETFEDVQKTVAFINKHKIQGLKIHSTYVIKNTKLCELYESGNYTPLTLEEYIDAVLPVIWLNALLFSICVFLVSFNIIWNESSFNCSLFEGSFFC